MKNLLFIAAISLTLTRLASADTSYLLIQGPFAGTNSPASTFEFKVNYAPGSLNTGLDLMNAVFGPATDTHTTYQGYEVYSGSTTIGGNPVGVSYIDFVGGGSSLFVTSFTLGGTTVMQDMSFDPDWNAYVAGGAGAFNGGPYPSTGSWNFAMDGVNSRTLSDGSFDGWVFGDPNVPVTISNFSPTVADFAGATVINVGAVPEPGSALLLAAGGLLLFRRRR